MMTREEAIEELERLLRHWDDLENDKRCFWGYDNEAVALALSAIRPISREQIAKIWPGCDACEIPCNNCESIYAWDRYGKPQECTGCPENGYKNYTPESQFCEFCGRPLTDEAVDIIMRRLETLYETT